MCLCLYQNSAISLSTTLLRVNLTILIQQDLGLIIKQFYSRNYHLLIPGTYSFVFFKVLASSNVSIVATISQSTIHSPQVQT